MSRTLVISDVHANAHALDAVLAAEPDRDSVVFLGDAVDNGPHPDAVCDRLRDLDLVACVRGNHDRTVLDAGDGSEASNSDDDPFARWQAWTYDQLSADNRQFLRSLDRTTTVEAGGRTLRLHHGDFPHPDDYDDDLSPSEEYDGEWRTRATPDDDPSLFETVARRYDEDVVVHGHSHYPFEATVAGTTFVNPGSVGLQRAEWPAERARYAVIEDGDFDLRSVEYDPNTVAADARALESPFLEIWGQPGASASTD